MFVCACSAAKYVRCALDLRVCMYEVCALVRMYMFNQTLLGQFDKRRVITAVGKLPTARYSMLLLTIMCCCSRRWLLL